MGTTMFLALALLSFTSLFGQYEITKQCFQAPEGLGKVNLFYSDTDKTFSVLNNGQMKPVQRAFMDKELRQMDARTLHKFLGAGYISLQKMDNDEFSLKAKVRGLGGGPIGATVGTVGGAAVVQGAYWGALAGISAVLSPIITPVGAGAVVGVIKLVTAGPVAVATKVSAVGCGIALGVATGPF